MSSEKKKAYDREYYWKNVEKKRAYGRTYMKKRKVEKYLKQKGVDL